MSGMYKYAILKYSKIYGVIVVNIVMLYLFNKILQVEVTPSGDILGVLNMILRSMITNSILYVILVIVHVLLVFTLTIDIFSSYLNRVVFALYFMLVYRVGSYVLVMEFTSLLVSFVIVRTLRAFQNTVTPILAYLAEIKWSNEKRALNDINLPSMLASHSLASSLLLLILFSIFNLRVVSNTQLVVTINIVVSLLLLIVGIITSKRLENPEQELIGFTSGMGLIGLVPFLASLSLSSEHTARILNKILYSYPPGLYLGEVRATLTYGAPRNIYEKPENKDTLLRDREVTWHWRRTKHSLYVKLEELNTPHIVIVGASGSGKTRLAKHIAVNSSKQYGYNLLIIDPHGEYKDIAGIIKCRVMDASKYALNPLILGNTSPRERALQLSHVISTLFKLGYLQRQMLEEIILRTYESKGIIQSDPSTWVKEPPTIEDLVKTCMELGATSPEYQRVLPYLNILRENMGSGSWLSIDELFSENVIIDTSSLSSDFARALFLDTLMYMLISKMYNMRSTKKIQVVFEEARGLMPRQLSRELLSRLFTESRKFGFSIIVISQEIHGIPRVLINNAGLRIFFIMNEPRSVEEASKIIAGADVKEKIQVVSETLRTLDPHVFILHATGVETAFIVKSPVEPLK